MSELQNLPETEDKQKSIDRLVSLWIHQNTLLWSRLQTLTALQVPVLGGWYFFWKDHHNVWAVLIAAFGAVLSLLIRELIECDASRRDFLRLRMKPVHKADFQVVFPDQDDVESKKDIYPKRRVYFGVEVRGIWVMRIILLAFLIIDLALAGGTFIFKPPS